jgi:hypothetical protein
VADYVGPGVSATDDRRPEFQRMIDAATIKPPAFDVILVHSFIRTRDGGRWGLGAVHKVLTRTTYVGHHRFNTKFWKTRERKPDTEVVEMAVPPIIAKAEFEAVQALLKSRSPALTAPRIVSGPTLLTGICLCAACGMAMTLRTGKSGRYRYYKCSTKAR